jgi:hypothetical protein
MSLDNNENHDFEGSKFREEVYSKSVRAGKRTYFFDVKSTRNDELYLTITESKKRNGYDGNISYEKHKIFLYKEDFEKFVNGLSSIVDYINDRQPVVETAELRDEELHEYTDIEFDDLSK